jgi:hypothetical protein
MLVAIESMKRLRQKADRPRIGRCPYVVALTTIVVALTSAHADVVTDNFSDGTDTGGDPVNNPTWTHLDGYIGSTGQTWDASTGEYHLTAPSNGFENIGFVGSHVGPNFNDVRVSMDVKDFHTTFTGGPPGPSFIHIMARANGDNDFGELTGYAYGYDFIANAGAGELVLLRLDNGVDLNDIGAQRVHLDEGKDYRFVLEVIGDMIHGQTFNLTDGGVMVAESFAKITGAENFYASGTSGIFGYTESPFTTDFTIDNFRAETAVAGDYNRNGTSDAADYVIWRKTVGQQTPQLEPGPSFAVIGLGLMPANGAVSGACGHDRPNCEIIDDADYSVWYTNFGRSAASGGSSPGTVPEPTTGMLNFLGVVGVSFVRRNAARSTQ